jgi:hypothetical protein
MARRWFSAAELAGFPRYAKGRLAGKLLGRIEWRRCVVPGKARAKGGRTVELEPGISRVRIVATFNYKQVALFSKGRQEETVG